MPKILSNLLVLYDPLTALEVIRKQMTKEKQQQKRFIL